jgi:hypothetical protein
VICTLVGAAAASLVVGIVSAQGGAARQPLRSWGFGAGTSTAPIPHIRRPRTIQLQAHDFVAAPIDNAPSGLSQGDAITVNGLLSRLHNSSDSNIGRVDVNEVFTDLQPSGGAILLITVTASLPEGQITAVGVGRVSHTGTITIKLPIAGGSGRYRNARGTLLGKPNGNGTATRLVYLLIP